VPIQSSEYVAETYYTHRPLNGLEVRPKTQYAIEPGGTSPNRNVLVFDPKTVTNF
jgi:porin